MAIEEIEPMLSERIEKWSNELRAEGRVEGKAEFLLSLIETKFGAVSDDLRATIETATTEQILRMGERLLAAETPADLLLG